jgi:proteic killer suppression protein
MIKSFSDKELEHCWMFGQCEKIKQDLVKRVLRKLDILDAATSIRDVYGAPGCRGHELTGQRAGQYTVEVNGPWRIVFRFKDGDAYDVVLEQYH